MKKLLFWIFVIILVYFSSKIYFDWTRPNEGNESRVVVNIPPNTSIKLISEILEDKELIRSNVSFEFFVRWKNLTNKIQAGEYVLSRNLTYDEISEILQHGKADEQKVTIPEGSTIKQIDEILTKKNLILAGEFEKCANFCDFGFRISSLEGYLWASTYFVNPKTFSSKNFINRLYQNFQIQIKKLDSGIKNSGRNLDEIVKVASMIEREAYGNNLEEKKMIADVIWKRLDENIHLGIDATTRYELNNWKKPLYAENFAKKTPYNTRTNYGLPPTAISNPSFDSLEASVSPSTNDYYYYLHDTNGKIRFAKNLTGHNENKSKYLY